MNILHWRYNDSDYIDKHDDSLYGFIYCVYFENDLGDIFKYYGKKKWFAENTISELKSGLRRENSIGTVRKLVEMSPLELEKRTKTQVRSNVRNKLVTFDIVHSDNDWRTYTGSCKDTKGYIPIYKEIICFTRTQREHTYLETKVMFQRGALEDNDCLNANIMGRFYRGRLV